MNVYEYRVYYNLGRPLQGPSGDGVPYVALRGRSAI